MVQNNQEQASSVDGSPAIAAPPSVCGCISEVGNFLREHNACLETTLFSQPERVVIRTSKIDTRKRGNPPPMLATFCPFCGTRYPADTGPLARLNGASQ